MAPRYTRWEETVDIPEFHGGISGDSLLYWFEDVEEILEFQNVSEKRLVSLVVEKFRGQAKSWWRQVKTTRERAGKSPIKSWSKLKQKLCATFLPHHSHSLVYNRLQDLKQQKCFVDYKESYRFQGNDIVHLSDHGIYHDDNDLKQGERFVYGFAENCQFQDKDFVGEQVHVHDRYEHLDLSHDKDGDVLDLDVYNKDDEDGGKGSFTFNDERPHEVEQKLSGPSVFDIYDDEDPPYDIRKDDDSGRFVEDKTETEFVSAVVRTSCGFVYKQSCDLCLMQAQSHLNYLVSQYTTAHFRRRDLMFELGHFLWLVFSEDLREILTNLGELAEDGYLHDLPPMRDKADEILYSEDNSRTSSLEVEETDAGGITRFLEKLIKFSIFRLLDIFLILVGFTYYDYPYY